MALIADDRRSGSSKKGGETISSLRKKHAGLKSKFGNLDKRQHRLADSHWALTRRVQDLEQEVQQILSMLVSVRIRPPK